VPCTASLGRNVGLFDLLNVVNSKNYEGYTLELEMEVSLKNGISRKVKLDPFKVEDLLNGFQDE
jgi:hypothetical protein